MDRSELLVEHGFIKKDEDKKYEKDEKTNLYKPVPGSKLSPADADEEMAEIVSTGDGGDFQKTGFPKPRKTFRLVYEVYDLSLEEPYFWILHSLRESFSKVDKLEDSFAAAENSAFFGVTQQRLGAQQDKISQFLATVGKMIKELFQMVRELRIIDERMEYYEESEKELQKPFGQRGRSAEITLKGLFVDLVQGGGKSAASVYGMARELEFVTLPDLFFDAPPFRTADELENHLRDLEKNFNLNVTRVLGRHLRQFMQWKKSTHKEHANRRRFMLNYLQQHFEIINMYLTWVKPYLRHTEKLTLKSSSMKKPDIISAFEGSMLDLEILASRRVDVNGAGANGCLLVTFHYRTRPELKVVQEGYQRGPVHIGEVEIQYRVYGWTDEQLENYKRLKERETILMMGDVSTSVQQAMQSLGDDLQLYLDEAKGIKKEEEKKEGPARKSFTERFLGDFYTPAKKKAAKKSKGQSSRQKRELEDKLEELIGDEGSLVGYSIGASWLAFHNFKKAHRMIAW